MRKNLRTPALALMSMILSLVSYTILSWKDYLFEVSSCFTVSPPLTPPSLFSYILFSIIEAGLASIFLIPFLVFPTASIIMLHRDPREQWLLLGSFGVIAVLELGELLESGEPFWSGLLHSRWSIAMFVLISLLSIARSRSKQH